MYLSSREGWTALIQDCISHTHIETHFSFESQNPVELHMKAVVVTFR